MEKLTSSKHGYLEDGLAGSKREDLEPEAPFRGRIIKGWKRVVELVKKRQDGVQIAAR
jgi:hypothetical protein